MIVSVPLLFIILLPHYSITLFSYYFFFSLSLSRLTLPVTHQLLPALSFPPQFPLQLHHFDFNFLQPSIMNPHQQNKVDINVSPPTLLSDHY